MVLSSIGYRSEPLQGVPFDPRLGVIPNRCARAAVFLAHAAGFCGTAALLPIVYVPLGCLARRQLMLSLIRLVVVFVCKVHCITAWGTAPHVFPL